ncbi:general secretion pathway protein GspN [Pseudomonas japonica]|uniref:general secretion pathway protein GspN n=1 Tax=Pseudomonas japonica TaxID=256466 RepID=UPI0015E449CF|nr:general secretion pathway protein GspN [Pseudomonas japonica]MBA1242478.1 general secretion pathway protein GspN [Pseudomonas japonica]
MKPHFMTFGLLALNAGLAASFAWLLLAGPGPIDDPALEPHPAVTVAEGAPLAPTALEPAAMAVAWARPLFSPDRQPDAPKAGPSGPGLDGLSLTGVVIDGTAQWALLRQRDKRPLKFQRGDTLDGGWVLTALGPTSATFTRQGQARTLSLPVLRLPLPSLAPAPKLPDVSAP